MGVEFGSCEIDLRGRGRGGIGVDSSLVFKEGFGDALRLFSTPLLIFGIGCRRFNSPLDFFLRGVP